MQNNQIPDSALRASTSYNPNSMGPGNGRLHFQAKPGKYGSWAVSKNDEFQYFEVNFGDWTRVTKIATQGRQDGGWWTKSYSLAYSYDGVFFEDYKEDNNVKVSSSSWFLTEAYLESPATSADNFYRKAFNFVTNTISHRPVNRRYSIHFNHDDSAKASIPSQKKNIYIKQVYRWRQTKA